MIIRGVHIKDRWLIVFGVAVILAAIILILLLGHEECNDWECFYENLEGCKRTVFIGGDDMIFRYTIQGKSGDECEVEVELLQGELNNQESEKMEGLEMICYLPYGVQMTPESDIDNCHGLLREGLQDLVINRMYSYLLQNLGTLNLEVSDIEYLSE